MVEFWGLFREALTDSERSMIWGPLTGGLAVRFKVPPSISRCLTRLLLIKLREVLVSHHGQERELLHTLEAFPLGMPKRSVPHLSVSLPALQCLSLLDVLEEVVLVILANALRQLILLIQSPVQLLFLLLLVQVLL